MGKPKICAQSLTDASAPQPQHDLRPTGRVCFPVPKSSHQYLAYDSIIQSQARDCQGRGKLPETRTASWGLRPFAMSRVMVIKWTSPAAQKYPSRSATLLSRSRPHISQYRLAGRECHHVLRSDGETVDSFITSTLVFVLWTFPVTTGLFPAKSSTFKQGPDSSKQRCSSAGSFLCSA